MAIPRHGSKWVVNPIGRIQSTVRGLCVVPKEPPHKWSAHFPGNSANTHTTLPGGTLMAVPRLVGERAGASMLLLRTYMASELTQTLSAWNGRGEGGSYLARRLRLKEASGLYVDRHITGCDITGYRPRTVLYVKALCAGTTTWAPPR